jgi:hypothetical protein
MRSSKTRTEGVLAGSLLEIRAGPPGQLIGK